MQKRDGKLLLSASDLVYFTECAHRTSLDLVNLETKLPRAAEDEQMVLIAEKGNQHEANYLQALKNRHKRVVEIDKGLGPAEAAAATLKAMRDGADIIFQATFAHENRVGHADFLRKVERPSALGNHSYEVIDTKLARSSRAKFLIQLCFYSELLAIAQGVPPLMMHVVLGTGKEVNYRVADYQHYVDGVQEAFLSHIANRPQTRPEPCSHCSLCPWREICNAQWVEEDHLSLVADIRKTQILKLAQVGVTTLEALAKAPPTLRVPKLQAETFDKLRAQAKMQLEMRKTGALTHEVLPGAYAQGKGFNKLPPPSEGDIYFDIEGNPLEEGGLEYLLGVVYRDNCKDTFRAFWAHSRNEEKASFEAFMDFIQARLQRYPDLHIYHYAPYENTAIKKLMTLHGTRESQVDNLLRRGILVDLYKVVRETIRTSANGYSLKDIEGLFMHKRDSDVTNASASIVYYEKWKEIRDDELLQQISDYNEFDCRSLKALHDWLMGIRDRGIKPTQQAQKADEAERAPSEKAVEREAILARFKTLLVDALPATRELWTEEQRLSELIFFLLDFHRRADKPAWWAIFKRLEMTVEELIDEAESIGGLTLDPDHPPRLVKRSTVFTYRYPEQEFKLREGNSCIQADTAQRAGSIETIDERQRRIQIKRGNAGGALPKSLSIGPTGPIDHEPLVKAVYRFAEKYAGNEDVYGALMALLRKEIPRTTFVQPGAPLINPEKGDPLQQTIDAVDGLQSSYLFIQGPPGAGKTYTGSHIIVELLRRGRTVGVSSNSHKAINNLLTAIESVALERNVKFRGVKKAGKESPDSMFEGEIIIDVFDNKDVYGFKHQLVAGTAWLFAAPEMNQTLDYLFIDEAGQVALANLIAMGVSARNIVLLGDQMQLSQPIQGAHPGRSGESALDYLLDGDSTIAPERGVFLEKTWRMHPDVCEFISEAVYDGRLHAESGNSKQRLVLGDSAHPGLQPTGIRFLPCEHEGCSQRSDEEAGLVAGIYQSALQQSFIDRSGTTHRMGIENILVVAPYNMQVNRLKEVLPEGARVGTVDKFQGQEAELVIISMATSSEDTMPRQMDFLFSRNRLNVALSRARCLSVLVANPQLMRVACTHPQEMALVNTLCWVNSYSYKSQPSAKAGTSSI
jgi:predicted RecB family nuclease